MVGGRNRPVYNATGSGHGCGSLIAKGLNVVFVSRQLGHANPTVTLGTYAHRFG